MQKYDTIVIGGGSGGLTTASGLSKIGKKVLLIEKDKLGGECTHSGCIPSKALLHLAKSYYHANKTSTDKKNLQKFKNNILKKVRQKITTVADEEDPEVFKKKGITVISGEAKFISPHIVAVDNKKFGAKHIVISTGSSPRMVDIPGLNKADLLTNQNIFDLEEIPKKLLIIGAGPIGMELGQAFAILGSKVSIASIGDRFAHLEDPEISTIIENKFNEIGIDITLNAFIKEIRNKEAIFKIKNKEKILGEISIPFDKILVAIGRVPNLDLNLKKAGINYNEYGIQIDSNYRTNVKHIFAIGDVSMRMKFTHTADDAARTVVKKILFPLFPTSSKKPIPKVTYTYPEIAAVGLSFTEAVKKYSPEEVMKISVPFSRSDRAVTDNATEGKIVVVARRLSGKILGVNIIGQNAGEILSFFTLAIDQKISLWKIQNIIFPYPTISSIIKVVADEFLSETITSWKKDLPHIIKKHIPKIFALFFWVLIIYLFQHYRLSNELSYKDVAINLFSGARTNSLGPIIFMLAYAIRPLIFFPASIMTLLAGILFGPILGVIYTIIGENASANLAYLIGRFFGKGHHPEDSIFAPWISRLQNNSFMSILLMRLMYFPFDLVNFTSGLLRVNWRSYAAATFIGILPGLTTFVLLGSSIKNAEDLDLSTIHLSPKLLIFSAILFITSIALSHFLKNKKIT